jgi:hypothetical protein
LNIDAFQADREVTSGEAIVYHLKTKKQINVNHDQQVRNSVQELTQKKKIKETVHSYLIQDILLSSKALMLPNGTPVPNRRIDDLCEIWSQNASMAENMWNILIKQYEDNGEWEVKFEQEVMDSLNLENVEENGTHD